jgi:hypothetical protein
MMMLFVLAMVAAVAALVFAVTALLQLLWNMTLPELFGIKTIGYWQAFRVLLIACILFGPGAFFTVNAGNQRASLGSSGSP